MKNLILFIRDFFRNQGIWVMFSILISKLSLFLTQLIVIRLLPKENLGSIVYFVSIMSFFLPIVGLGSYQGLLRFVALTEDEDEKENISRYAFRKGFAFQLIVNCLFIILCVILAHEKKNSFIIVSFLSLRLFMFFVLQTLQAHYRAFHKNHFFSQLNIYFNVISFLGAFLLTYLYSTIGYIVSLGIIPFVVLFFIKRRMLEGEIHFKEISKKTFWRFSINASLAWLISDFIFVLDILLGEHYLSDKVVAEYKTLILLPFNLWIIPQIIIQTDYPKLCSRYLDFEYMKNYMINFSLLLFLVAIPIVTMSYFFRYDVIPFLFGKQYFGGTLLFILVVVIVVSWFFKTLFSNLLGAIGKVYYNAISGIISVVVLFVSGIILIPIYQLSGLVYSVCLSITISAVFTFIFFLYAYHRILKNHKI